jgi:hypothetical protein
MLEIRDRVSHIRNIKRDKLPCPFVPAVPMCLHTFCLAETILHFCVFNCDSSGLWGVLFLTTWALI